MASQSPAAAPSALSGTLGEMVGEFFGTMVLLLFGDGCVATFALFTKLGTGGAAGGDGGYAVSARAEEGSGRVSLDETQVR